MYISSIGVDDGQGKLLLTSGNSILYVGLEIENTPQYLYNVSEQYNITGIFHKHIVMSKAFL